MDTTTDPAGIGEAPARPRDGNRLTHLAAQRARADDQRDRGNERTFISQDIGEIPPPKNPARRAAALANYGVFLKTYFPHRFPLAWSKDHLKVIAEIEATIRTGESCGIAMPRGSGKTTLLEPAPVWAIANKLWRFGVIIAASRPMAIEILNSLKDELRTNDLLHEDFPEFTAPIRHIENEPRRCKGQRYNGRLTGIRWETNMIRLAGMPAIGVDGGIVYAAGLTAALRGLRMTLSGGVVVRPDGAIIDDPQTDASARSASQTLQRLKLIQGAIRGMAGPGRRLSIFAAVTVIQPQDLAERLLDPKETGWRVVRTKSLYAFPQNMDLWRKYQEIRRDDAALGVSGGAVAFYVAHQAAMDEGAIVAWPERMSAGKISALQELMEYYLDDPEAFSAEHQQEPITPSNTGGRLDAAVFARKVNGRDRGDVPPGCPFVVAYIDTHDKAFFWTVIAFEQRFKSYVVDYGTWPEQATRDFTLGGIQKTLRRKYPGRTLDASMFAGMDELVASLYARRFPKANVTASVDMILADTGYKPELWHQLATKHTALKLTKGVGIKAGNRPMIEWDRKPGEVVGTHWLRTPARQREHPVTQIDTNYWKTVVIDAAVAPAGDSAALTIFGAERTVHTLFASHIDAEAYVETEGYGRKVVEAKQKPGRDNHWLDCTVGCFVGASMLGARSEGAPAAPQRTRLRRKYTQADLAKRRPL